jgi:nicotinate-nucleotide adenylyltransferase
MFNPPHVGHVALARHAGAELGLERVVLMPASRPPHKPPGRDPGPEHRVRMCELAVVGADGLGVCALEVERGGTSFTVDTLRAMRASCPETRLTFVLGADVARTLPRWREPERVVELADLAVAEREGASRGEVLEALRPLLEGARTVAGGRGSARVEFLRMPRVAVSSSMVRELVARGRTIDGLVGRAVAGYVAEHGLYRDPAGESAPEPLATRRASDEGCAAGGAS